MAKTYKIFISHSWDYVDDLIRLRNLLEQRGYFHVEFTEASPENPINSDKSKYIRTVLSQRIESSDIVLCIAGIYASYSDWMEWELDKAIEKNIPIVIATTGFSDQDMEKIQKYTETLPIFKSIITKHFNILL